MTANRLEGDAFIELSLATESTLNDAIPELAWISAGGGTPSPSLTDRLLAEDKEREYRDRRSVVRERLLAYLSKRLVVEPPTEEDLKKAKQIATDLSDFRNQSVTVTSVIRAVTDMLNIYSKS